MAEHIPSLESLSSALASPQAWVPLVGEVVVQLNLTLVIPMHLAPMVLMPVWPLAVVAVQRGKVVVVPCMQVVVQEVV